MKVKKEQSTANRAALLSAAGPLFREKGMDGVGVAEVCQAAGLTHGALYSHFGSKDALAAEALLDGHRASVERMNRAIGTKPSAREIIDFYVSARHRDSVIDCCPLVAASSEASRQQRIYQESYAAAFHEIERSIREAMPISDGGSAQFNSLVVAASMIGIVAVARALNQVEPETSDQLLAAASDTLKSIVSKA